MAVRLNFLSGVCVLATILTLPFSESLPSPVAGQPERYVYDIDLDFGYDSSASHHRQTRTTGRGESLDHVACENVTAVPHYIRVDFRLDKFYQIYTHAYGIPIVASNVSQDAALTRACYTVRFLLADRKDLRDAMYDSYGRVGVIALTERTTQIPEHSYLNSDLWDERARGLGGTPNRPISTCGEENILCLRYEDRWYEEDILIHEFTHAIHLISLRSVDPTFQTTLIANYEQAKTDNLWEHTYAITNYIEYFAEGVQGFFNVQTCRSFRDNVHNSICTRDALRSYDPRLYDLITQVFPCMNTIVNRCESNQDLAANQVLRMNCNITIRTTTNVVTDNLTTVTTTEIEDTTTVAGVTTTVAGLTTTGAEVTTTGATTIVTAPMTPSTSVVATDPGSTSKRPPFTTLAPVTTRESATPSNAVSSTVKDTLRGGSEGPRSFGFGLVPVVLIINCFMVRQFAK